MLYMYVCIYVCSMYVGMYVYIKHAIHLNNANRVVRLSLFVRLVATLPFLRVLRPVHLISWPERSDIMLRKEVPLCHRLMLGNMA